MLHDSLFGHWIIHFNKIFAETLVALTYISGAQPFSLAGRPHGQCPVCPWIRSHPWSWSRTRASTVDTIWTQMREGRQLNCNPAPQGKGGMFWPCRGKMEWLGLMARGQSKGHRLGPIWPQGGRRGVTWPHGGRVCGLTPTQPHGMGEEWPGPNLDAGEGAWPSCNQQCRAWGLKIC